MTEKIIGTDGHEEIFGTAEDDTLESLSGYDTLDGGEGSDTYIVNADDYLGRFIDLYNDTGSNGTDVILASEAGIEIGLGSGFSAESGIEAIDGLENSTIVGDNENQIWDFSETSISGIDGIYGFGGRDEITGTNFADTVYGGAGSDTLLGGKGDDTLHGGDDSDFIDGGNGKDTIYGDAGHDTIDGGNSRDFIFGGEGHDTILGGTGSDLITAGAGFDTLDGGEHGDRYFVGLENAGFVDTYNDTGTLGVDRILATDDGTVIGLIDGFGTNSGIEIIAATGNQDVTIGGTNGSETWDFSQVRLSGIQWINSLDGHDVITANDQNNSIDAGAGHDIVDAGAGNDTIIGKEGNDILNGGDGKDRLDGGSGFDILDGGNGDDIYLFGTDSNGFIDTIVDSGTSTNDRIYATDNDVEIGLQSDFSTLSGIETINARRFENVTIEGSGDGVNWDFSDIKLIGIASINGNEGRDIIQGSNRSDVINGGAGHDQLYGGIGRDTLNGGADSDFLFGERGRDTLLGGAGNDVLNGGQARDFLTGGEGFDIFEYGPGSGDDIITDFTLGEDFIDLNGFDGEVTYEDLRFVQTATGLRVYMGDSSAILENVFLDSLPEEAFILPEVEIIADEDVIIVGGNGTDELDGGSGNDSLSGSHGDETILGHEGDDILDGGNGNDSLLGGSGSDVLIGFNGDDTLFGEDGDDTLDGGNNNDTLEGGAGDDTLIGFNGTDVLIGGDGHDNLDGGNDNDILEGGAGHDVLDGFNGRDILDGGEGNDILLGFNDADSLTGGSGNDILTGGFGADQFVFNQGDGHDRITDFESGQDVIDFTSFDGGISFEDLSFVTTDTGTRIDYEDSSILLEDFAIDAITEDMFIF